MSNGTEPAGQIEKGLAGGGPSREANLDAVRSDQQQLRDQLSELYAIAVNIETHLQGDRAQLAPKGADVTQERATPPGILGQMCEQGTENSNAVNRIAGVVQSIGRLSGAN